MTETAHTRALRRATHDGYAPFAVRPATRRYADPAFDGIGRAITIVAVALFAGLCLFNAFRLLY
jgi:hypothetical protein